MEELDVKYLCLLDDDVEIKKDFCSYINNIFHHINDIPLLSNYNFELPYETITHNNIHFIKTINYFGNFIVFNRKYIKKYGYMRIFDYKWGHEHIDITHRYLNNTKYKDYAIELSSYINNFQIINLKNTLHLHSCIVENDKVINNKNILDKYSNNFSYVEYIFDKTEIMEFTLLELNKMKYIDKKIQKYNNLIQKYIIKSKHLKNDYWNNINLPINHLYKLISNDYLIYNNNFNNINKFINKLEKYNINDDLKKQILIDIDNIKNIKNNEVQNIIEINNNEEQNIIEINNNEEKNIIEINNNEEKNIIEINNNEVQHIIEINNNEE